MAPERRWRWNLLEGILHLTRLLCALEMMVAFKVDPLVGGETQVDNLQCCGEGEGGERRETVSFDDHNINNRVEGVRDMITNVEWYRQCLVACSPDRVDTAAGISPRRCAPARARTSTAASHFGRPTCARLRSSVADEPRCLHRRYRCRPRNECRWPSS